MISYNEIVAVEYKGLVSEYNSEAKIRALLNKLSNSFDEVFILQTSQRLAVFVYADGLYQLEEILQQEGIQNPADTFHNTKVAIQHLFEVASGGKSEIIGESAILDKIQAHLLLAQNEDAIGPYLSKMVHASIECGFSVQGQLSPSNIKRSFLLAGMDFVLEHYQSFHLRVLVIGSADLAEEILEFLQDQDVERIYVANHSFEEAKRLANQYDAFPLKSGNLSLLLPELDVVFGCGQKDKLLKAIYEHQENDYNGEQEKNTPLYIDYDNIYTSTQYSELDTTLTKDYFNQYSVGQNGKLQNSDIVNAGENIEKCTMAFYKKFQHMKVETIVKKYLEKLKKIEQQELDNLFSLLDNRTEETQALIEQFSNRILKRMSRDPIVHLKQLAENLLDNQEGIELINKVLNGDKPNES